MTEYNFRQNSSKGGTYRLHPNYGVHFTKSFFPYFTIKWNNLPKSIRFSDFIDFKIKLKSFLKPPKFKHFAYGGKLGNKLLTRLRVGRTFLNSHSYTIGRSESPSCLCHERNETVRHYLLHCFLYTIERQVLFDQVTHCVPNFKNLSQENKTEILLNGSSKLDHLSNIEITKSVQNYILNSKRFLIRN